jgi:hypothetical protein
LVKRLTLTWIQGFKTLVSKEALDVHWSTVLSFGVQEWHEDVCGMFSAF